MLVLLLAYKRSHKGFQVIDALLQRTCGGAIAIGENSTLHCLDMLGKCKSDKRIAMATSPIPSHPKLFAVLQIISSFVTSVLSIFIKPSLRGIKTSCIVGSVADSPIADAVYAIICRNRWQVVSSGLHPNPI
jgi:hypothetical protein